MGSTWRYMIRKDVCIILSLYLIKWSHGECFEFCWFLDNDLLLVYFHLILFWHNILFIIDAFHPGRAFIWPEIPPIPIFSLPCPHYLCAILSRSNPCLALLTASLTISDTYLWILIIRNIPSSLNLSRHWNWPIISLTVPSLSVIEHATGSKVNVFNSGDDFRASTSHLSEY